MVMTTHDASASPFHDALRHFLSYRLYARARPTNLETRDAHQQMVMRAKKRPVLGGGRPSDGPTADRLAGGGQPVPSDSTPDTPAVKVQRNAQGRALTRQVGAGSKISRRAEPGREPTNGVACTQRHAIGDVNGSFAATYDEGCSGNSRASLFCLLGRRT